MPERSHSASWRVIHPAQLRYCSRLQNRTWRMDCVLISWLHVHSSWKFRIKYATHIDALSHCPNTQYMAMAPLKQLLHAESPGKEPQVALTSCRQAVRLKAKIDAFTKINRPIDVCCCWFSWHWNLIEVPIGVGIYSASVHLPRESESNFIDTKGGWVSITSNNKRKLQIMEIKIKIPEST
jgi:hypothetical protein